MKCFYHTDLDGKCAGAIVYFSHNGEGEYIPIDYKDDFPFDKILPDEEVIIVDFSLQKEGDWEKLLKITQDVIWIDHHKTAIEKNKKLAEELEGIRQVCDTMGNPISGCELTWKFFYEDDEIPLAIIYAGRYDVWDFSKYGEILNEFQTGIRLHAHNPEDEIWETLFNNNQIVLDGILGDGKIALLYRNNQYSSLIKTWSFGVTFEGHKAICCNVGSVSSQLFDSVKEDYDLMIPFVFDGKQWTVSLYTKKDIDCSAIAKKYGGGGHKQAAGFQCKELPFRKESS